jgi:hypothetical protein
MPAISLAANLLQFTPSRLCLRAPILRWHGLIARWVLIGCN